MCKRTGADIGEIYLMFLTNICFPNKYIILEKNCIISKTYILFSTATHEDHLKNYSRHSKRVGGKMKRVRLLQFKCKRSILFFLLQNCRKIWKSSEKIWKRKDCFGLSAKGQTCFFCKIGENIWSSFKEIYQNHWWKYMLSLWKLGEHFKF